MATVQVILTQDIDSIGKSGEVVRVRPGYARNYLLPRGLAVGATAKNVARIEHEQRAAQVRAARLRGEAEALAQRLSTVKIQLARAAGEGDRLYGAVTAKDVAAALRALGHEVDKKQLVLEPIRALGVTTVQAKLAPQVTASFEVEVVAK